MLPWSRAKRLRILPTVQGCEEEVFGEPFDADCGKPSHSSAVKSTQWSAASELARECAGRSKVGCGTTWADKEDPSSTTGMAIRTARPPRRHALYMSVTVRSGPDAGYTRKNVYEL